MRTPLGGTSITQHENKRGAYTNGASPANDTRRAWKSCARRLATGNVRVCKCGHDQVTLARAMCTSRLQSVSTCPVGRRTDWPQNLLWHIKKGQLEKEAETIHVRQFAALSKKRSSCFTSRNVQLEACISTSVVNPIRRQAEHNLSASNISSAPLSKSVFSPLVQRCL